MKFWGKQLRASYILDSLLDKIQLFSKKEQEVVLAYYQHFSNFELVTNFAGKPLATNNSLRLNCLVGQNLIRRGIPTRAPKCLEECLKENNILRTEMRERGS